MQQTNSLQKIEDYMNRDQEQICTSPSPNIFIAGVAGSRKTDTMIRLGLRRNLLEKKNLLFLTQIGSVTDEIRTRIGNYIGKTIYKFGTSNHFICEHNGTSIEIANFDAWVHRQLEDCQWNLLKTMGGFHHFKSKSLLEMIEKDPECIRGFSLKNGTYADEILIDECQDFEGLKAHLIVGMLKLFPNVRSVFAGDKMQTLFEHSLLTTHPMQIFQTLNPTVFHLNRCFRCPKSHIAFSNVLLKRALVKHGCKEMTPVNKDWIHKPFLFPHGSVSKMFEVHQLVRQLVDMLDKLCEYDRSIVPSDVCFLMRKSNDQKVFDLLRVELDSFWEKRGYMNAVIHFATQHDGYRTPIQWEFAENKSCLISIHGDKGKGHKVVFFLGLSQGSIPEECAVHKEKELIYESLLNVALTRSTQYLFIGFHYARPSQYLTQFFDEIKPFCYPSWDLPPKTSKIYQKLASIVIFPKPLLFFTKIRDRPIELPSMFPCSLKDAVRNFERVEDLFGFHPKIQTVSLGKKFKIDPKWEEQIAKIAGVMLWSMIYPSQFREDIEAWASRPIVFTDNDRLICLVKDYHLNQLVGKPLFQDKLREMKETAHVDILKPLEEKDGYIFSSFLKPFLSEIQQFRHYPLHQIPFSIWWIFTCFFQEIRGDHCWKKEPCPIELFSNSLYDNVSRLFQQLSSEVELNNCHDLKATIYEETKLQELGFSKEMDETIFQRGLSFGLEAISDVIDIKHETLYLFKASPVDLTKEWILYASLCGSLPLSKIQSIKITKISVVNVLTGKSYTWDTPKFSWKSALEKIMIGFPLEMIQLLLGVNHRKLKKLFKE